MKNNKKMRSGSLVFVSAATLFLGACSTPTSAVVSNPELPDYKVDNYRIDESLDLYIEPRIKILSQEVVPHSGAESLKPISVNVGPALEQALIGVTRQHFSRLTEVDAPESGPTLSYTLLTFRPTISVDPRLITTALAVSARIAIEMKLTSSSGEGLFKSTIIGTSHISDKNIGPGKGLGDAARLLEVATREAIVDAMYDVSRQLGSNREFIASVVRGGADEIVVVVESLDDTVLHVQTVREIDE